MKDRILIDNRQSEQTPFRGWKSAVRRAVEATLRAEEVPVRSEISVALVSREEIRRLNREFRGVDRETDVLSFPLLEAGEAPAGKTAYLGDVLLCPAVIAAQAEEFGTGFRRETCFLAIHSTLHLLGYDHIKKKEKSAMFARQEQIFASLGEGEIRTEMKRNHENGE